MRRQAGRSKGSANDGQLKQAKQKMHKLERIGLYRDDGKAFKTHSLKTLDESAVRLPTQIQAAARASKVHFEFPEPSPKLRCSDSDAIVSLDDVAVSRCPGGVPPSPPILAHVTLHVMPRTRAALVGNNGAGKSTLMDLIRGDVECCHGHLASASGVRFG